MVYPHFWTLWRIPSELSLADVCGDLCVTSGNYLISVRPRRDLWNEMVTAWQKIKNYAMMKVWHGAITPQPREHIYGRICRCRK